MTMIKKELTAGQWTQIGDGNPIALYIQHNGAVFSGPVSIAEADVAPPAPSDELAEPYTDPVVVLRDFNTRVVIDATKKLWAIPTESNGSATLFVEQLTADPAEPSPSQDAGAMTVQTGLAYAAGKAIGGLLKFEDMTLSPRGMLLSVILRSKEILAVNFKLYLFSAKPASVITDDGTIVLSNKDDAHKFLGVVELTAPNTDLGVTIYDSRDINQILAAEAELYGILTPSAPVTFAEDDSLSIKLGIQ